MASDSTSLNDDSLAAWDDVEELHAWQALLVGNGLSQHVWKGFAYDSLFEEAIEAGNLDELDLRLFQEFATSNFERVLFALSLAVRVEDPLERDVRHLLERYRSIQRSLAETVRTIHLPWTDLPTESAKKIRAVMRSFRYVFTTSYDLILYWAASEGPSGRPFDGVVDYFWSPGRFGKCEFNPTSTSVFYASWTRLLFLHGALHLVEMPSGETVKRTANGQTLLEQFGEPFAGDDRALPLVVSEGTSEEKARAIQENTYLTFALDQLRECTAPLVVFGHSLSEEDAHLAEAINRDAGPVAVSITKQKRARQRKLEIAHRLPDIQELHFFDASTHPLATSDLRLSTFRLRRLRRRIPWFRGR